jgi:aspartyl-tRNA(Asn)/glutamyl-tRNA(Gln) amidotransferase subunit A
MTSDRIKDIGRFKKWVEETDEKPSFYASAIGEALAGINAEINSFGHFELDELIERSAEIAKDRRGSLWCVPVAVKDNICVKGALTTCASRVLEGFRPPYTSTVINRLLEEGALVIPGANMDEFAFGSSCETSCYGPVRNPFDHERIPGGSSGGSAASVSAGQVTVALGSDTGGSIRQPAAMCGVVGLKPTYGRVSRYGLIAFASSLDQIGPIASNVADCARVLEIISGYDEMDSTSVDVPVPDYTSALEKGVKGLRVGLPSEYFSAGIDADVAEKIRHSVGLLKNMGAKVAEISLPHTRYAVSCYYIIAPAEASSNLARYDGIHYGFRAPEHKGLIDMYFATRSAGFGEEVKRRVILGSYSLSSGYYDQYYLKAQKVRTKISEDFNRAFSQCDCILTPTTPTAAFRIGEKTDDPLKMYLSDVFTIPANLAGIPAMSMPCGLTGEGLPVGLQLMAPAFREEVIFRAASALEDALSQKKGAL